MNELEILEKPELPKKGYWTQNKRAKLVEAATTRRKLRKILADALCGDDGNLAKVAESAIEYVTDRRDPRVAEFILQEYIVERHNVSIHYQEYGRVPEGYKIIHNPFDAY